MENTEAAISLSTEEYSISPMESERPIPEGAVKPTADLFTIADGQYDENRYQGYLHELSRGNEAVLRKHKLAEDIRISNRSLASALEDLLQEGQVEVAKSAVDNVPQEAPENIVVEKMAAENLMIQAEYDSEYMALQEEPFSFQRAAEEDNAKLLALNSTLVRVMQRVAKAQPESFKAMFGDFGEFGKGVNTLGDFLAFFMPLYGTAKYASAFPEGVGFFAPGTGAKEAGEKIWSARSLEEFATELQKLEERLAEKFEDNPVMFFSTFMDAILTGRQDDPRVQRLWALKEFHDAAGESYENMLRELYDPKGIDGLLYDEIFRDIVDSPLTETATWWAAGIGTIALLRRISTPAIAAIAAANASIAAVNAPGAAAIHNILAPIRQNVTITDVNLRAKLDKIFDVVDTQLADRLSVPRVKGLTQAELDAEATRQVKPEFGTNFVNARYVNEGANNFAEVLIGTNKGNPFKDEASANRWARGKGLPYTAVVNPADPTGNSGWYLQTKRSVNEQGLYDNNLLEEIRQNRNWLDQLLTQNSLGKYVFSPSVTSKLESSMESSSGALEVGKISSIFGEIHKPIEKLNAKSKSMLADIINYGKQQPNPRAPSPGERGVWLNDIELENAWLDIHGRQITAKEKLAYYAYKESSDLNYHLMNDKMYKEYNAAGYNSYTLVDHQNSRYVGKIANKSDISDKSFILMPDGSVVGRGDIDDVTFNDPRNILIRVAGQTDYNGEPVTHVFGTKETLISDGLDRTLLGYTEGGTRNYVGRMFAKQKVSRKTTGGKDFEVIHTFGTFISKSKGDQFVKDLNDARKLVKEYIDNVGAQGANAAQYKANMARRIGSINPELVLDELIEEWQEGRFDLNSDVELRFDRDALFLPDDQLPNFERTQTFQRNGKMYYSQRGDYLGERLVTNAKPLHDDELAPLVNPFDALSRQQGHAAHTAGYADFGIKNMGAWVASFYRNNDFVVPDVVFPTVDEIFRNAVWNESKTGLDAHRRRVAAEAQRMFIKRIMHMTNTSTKWIEGFKGRMANRTANLLGDSKWLKDERIKTGRIFSDMQAVNFLKGLAYNLHLGLGNIEQILVQGSAAMTAIAMHPLHGAAAAKDYPLIRAAALSGMNEKVIARLDKYAVKLGLYKNSGDFTALVRDYVRSGLHNIGKTDSLKDTAEGMHTGGSIAGLRKRIMAIGRVPVYEGERIARINTFGIARRLAMEEVKKGTFKYGSDEYVQWIQGKTNALQVGMMSGMETWWQRNAFTALGTQFWQYPFKVMEVFLGLNRSLTKQEKLAFISTQTLAYGAMAVPLGTWAVDKGVGVYEFFLDDKVDKETYMTLMLGGVDALIRHNTGYESAMATKFGAGDLIFSALDDLNGDKSTVGLLTGIVGADLDKIFDISYQMGLLVGAAYMHDSELLGEISFDEQVMSYVASIAKGFNNSNKARLLHNYNQYMSTSGKVLEYNSKISWMAALIGYTDWKEYESWKGYGYVKKHEENLRDVAKQITQMKLKAYRELADKDTETFDITYRSIGAIMAMFPYQDKLRIMELVRKNLSEDQIRRTMRVEEVLPYKAGAQ